MKRTPLARGKPLARRTELTTHAEFPSRGATTPPARKKAPRRPLEPGELSKSAAEALARQLVYGRSQGDCELRIPGVCLGRATNWAHRIPQGQGGPWAASNGMHLCGMGNATGCHGYSEQHRAESYTNGWLLKRHQDPLLEPVVLWGGQTVWLTDNGDYWQPHPDDLPIADGRRGIHDASAA